MEYIVEKSTLDLNRPTTDLYIVVVAFTICRIYHDDTPPGDALRPGQLQTRSPGAAAAAALATLIGDDGCDRHRVKTAHAQRV